MKSWEGHRLETGVAGCSRWSTERLTHVPVQIPRIRSSPDQCRTVAFPSVSVRAKVFDLEIHLLTFGKSGSDWLMPISDKQDSTGLSRARWYKSSNLDQIPSWFVSSKCLASSRPGLFVQTISLKRFPPLAGFFADSIFSFLLSAPVRV